MYKRQEVSCVIDTINKAKARRNIDLPLIIHSDRGSQYVANEYKKATENLQRSYSKKAFPWDNACIESCLLYTSKKKRGYTPLLPSSLFFLINAEFILDQNIANL